MSLVQLQSSISDAIVKGQYNINTVFNSSLYGIQFMTVGLIGVTSMVLAYVTLVESNDSSAPELGSSESMIPSIPDFGIQKAFSSDISSNEEPEKTGIGGKSSKTKVNKKKTRRLHKK